MNRNEFINHTGIYSINDIKNHHRGNWFKPDTMRFFNSRISDSLFYDPKNNLIYFISSEKFDHKSPRLYTIRSYDPSTDTTETVGGFQAYSSLRSAKRRCLYLEQEGQKWKKK